jgi:exosome complex RNA-binding protein Rrp42 (RNase PH superfamily)
MNPAGKCHSMTKEELITFLEKGIRPDGRSLQTCRTPTISKGPSSSTGPSAQVCLGATSVLAGLTLAESEPHFTYPKVICIVPMLSCF